MTTTVTGKNQISIPAEIAARHGIRPGCRLEWKSGRTPDRLEVIIQPDPITAARSLHGAGRKYLRPGQDPIAELIAERTDDDGIVPKAGGRRR
jgi:AbrB family looped-hinge helix DNA binding protein